MIIRNYYMYRIWSDNNFPGKRRRARRRSRRERVRGLDWEILECVNVTEHIQVLPPLSEGLKNHLAINDVTCVGISLGGRQMRNANLTVSANYVTIPIRFISWATFFWENKYSLWMVRMNVWFSGDLCVSIMYGISIRNKSISPSQH